MSADKEDLKKYEIDDFYVVGANTLEIKTEEDLKNAISILEKRLESYNNVEQKTFNSQKEYDEFLEYIKKIMYDYYEYNVYLEQAIKFNIGGDQQIPEFYYKE